MHFFTGMHPEYTSPADLAHTVNPAGAAEILDLIFEITYDVASRPEQLAYRDASSNPGQGQDRGYGRVRLGIRTSMGADVATGVLVDAVMEDTSAANGGMKAGDIIVGWGKTGIDGLQDLFENLQTHEPGDTVKITVLRNGEKIVLDITFKSS